MKHISLIVVLIGIVVFSGCGGIATASRIEELYLLRDTLRPLCYKLPEPEPYDWLAYHEETGQTFEEYLACRPIMLSDARDTLYIQPLGTFTEEQEGILETTKEFLTIFYNCPVVTMGRLETDVVPDWATRMGGGVARKQLNTNYILQEILTPALPNDAVACIAFTANDLWPGRNWNFVLGMASLKRRVGVWSLYRMPDPAESEAHRLRSLMLTMKIATHEIGHMFSILHCTAFNCGMAGSNSLDEIDSHPLSFCAQCMPKICLATNADPQERGLRIMQFLYKYKFREDADFYRRLTRRIGEDKKTLN